MATSIWKAGNFNSINLIESNDAYDMYKYLYLNYSIA